MSIKPENAKDKIVLRDTKTGNLAGSVSTKGKDAPTVSAIDQKVNLTDNAKNLLDMKNAFDEIDAAAEAGDKKAIAQYDEARKKLDNALIALLPESIANIKLGDNVTHTYLVTGPEWDDLRAEIKISDSIVNEKILATLLHGSFGQDDNLYTLLSITPTELEEKEVSLEEAMNDQIDDWMKPRGISKESFNVPISDDEYPNHPKETKLEREWHSDGGSGRGHSIDDSYRSDCRLCGGKGLSEAELTEAISKRDKNRINLS